MSTSRAIVVLSCDRYSDLWIPVLNNLLTMLMDVPYTKYLVSNEKELRLDGIQNILTGPDKNWSTSLINALNKIPERQILLLLDDMPLHEKPNTTVIERSFEILEQHSLGALHPRSIPPQRRWHHNKGDWYEYSDRDSYTSNVYSFWDKDVLLRVIQEGESPWDFEVVGSKRLNQLARVGALKSDVLNTSNLVIKGKWAKNVSVIDLDLKLGLNLAGREKETKTKLNSKIKNQIFKLVLYHSPRWLQGKLFIFFNRRSRD